METSQSKPSGYEKMYATGAGWKYDFETERAGLQLITDAVGLRRGDTVLEIGCGEGFHSHVLYEMGFRVTGNERTEAGVTTARSRYPMVNYIQGDSLRLLDILPRGHFDMVIARGHSWWHYRLVKDEKRGIDVPGNTAKMFELLKPGGHFVLAIRTDFSGTHPSDSVSNNTRQDYVDLFSPLGEVVYVTDWLGRPLPDEEAARRSGKNIVIATRKPGGREAIHERLRREVKFNLRARRAREILAEAERRKEQKKKR